MDLRRIARVGVAHMTVRRIIRDESLRPYHVQYVQELQPEDHITRRNFCRWILHKLERNSYFLERVLFTDESSFSNIGMVNRQNLCIWALKNPHAMVERVNQGRFAINVWTGIVGNNIIGPVYLLLRLNSRNYLVFLQRNLLPFMGNCSP